MLAGLSIVTIRIFLSIIISAIIYYLIRNTNARVVSEIHFDPLKAEIVITQLMLFA